MSIVKTMFCTARPDRQFKEVQELIGLIDGMDKHTDGKYIINNNQLRTDSDYCLTTCDQFFGYSLV